MSSNLAEAPVDSLRSLPPPQRGSTAAERVACLDRLKVLLVAAIIAGHGVMSYSGLENAWPYQDVQEVALPHAADVVLGALAAPAALFTMGLFFLVSGLLTPGSLERKGTRRFVRDRLLRLGLPLVVWVLVIWPALVCAAHHVAGEQRSYWSQVAGTDPVLDTGPMWFVEVLLIYSLGYAAWRARRDGRAGASARDRGGSAGPLTGRTLTVLAVAISLGTALVRLVFPFASEQPAHPNVWQWPQYIGLFGLGIVAGRRGGLQPVPPGLAHRSGVAALVSVLALVLLGVSLSVTGVDPDVVFHARRHWAPMTLAVIEGPLAVGASLWLLGTVQQRLGRRLGRAGGALARGAYAAFVLQGVVLIGLALALRPAGLPVAVKAATVAVGGTGGSFALAWLVVARTPLGRVL
jgi:acyltransferase-like protein